jgi:DNA-binding CsgD family transcriptional regulator
MRRGRPPYPDVLTPREIEVLALIRDGLSNEQIAERLSISVNGVKYHVSEMLSKLHLDNRVDLARWQPDEPRLLGAMALTPLAFVRRIQPAWLSNTILGVLLVVVVAAVGVLVWGLWETEEDENATPVSPPQTAGDMFARMEHRLRDAGGVLHTTISTSNVEGETSQRMYTLDLWTDAANETVRTEFHKDPGWTADVAEEDVSIVSGEFVYRPDDAGEALRSEFPNGQPCAPSTLVSVLLQCDGYPGHVTMAKGSIPFHDDATYDELTAFEVVLTDGYANTEGGPDYTILSRAFVDRDSLLPLARVTIFEEQEPPGERREVRSTYEHEFVPRESLPDDYFDPRSIGYGAEEANSALADITRDIPAYWLGNDFSPGHGQDDLVLVTVETDDLPSEVGEPFRGFAGALVYETPEGIPAVNILLWSRASWEEYLASEGGSFITNRDCADPQSANSEIGPSVIYVLKDIEYPLDPGELGPCIGRVSAPPFTDSNLIGVVDAGPVIIDVRADPVGDFESVDAIEAVMAGLRRYD